VVIKSSMAIWYVCLTRAVFIYYVYNYHGLTEANDCRGRTKFTCPVVVCEFPEYVWSNLRPPLWVRMRILLWDLRPDRSEFQCGTVHCSDYYRIFRILSMHEATRWKCEQLQRRVDYFNDIIYGLSILRPDQVDSQFIVRDISNSRHAGGRSFFIFPDCSIRAKWLLY